MMTKSPALIIAVLLSQIVVGTQSQSLLRGAKPAVVDFSTAAEDLATVTDPSPLGVYSGYAGEYPLCVSH